MQGSTVTYCNILLALFHGGSRLVERRGPQILISNASKKLVLFVVCYHVSHEKGALPDNLAVLGYDNRAFLRAVWDAKEDATFDAPFETGGSLRVNPCYDLG